jgi:hypothetical protein
LELARLQKISLLMLLLLIGSLSAQTLIRSYQWTDLCPGPFDSTDSEMCNVIPAIGGGYILQGHVAFMAGDISALNTNVFWKLDEFGNVIWRRTGGLGFTYNAIVSNGVDRYYCLGYYYLDVYDAEMNRLNHYWFQQVNSFYMHFNDMIYDNDGLVLAGTNIGPNYVVKTDFQFDLVWQSSPIIAVHQFTSVAAYMDGWVATTARVFAQFTATGDSLWTYIDNDNLTHFFDCLITESNNIILLGLNDRGNVHLLVVNPIEQDITCISSGFPWYATNPGASICENSDNNIIVLAQSTNNNILHCFSPDGAFLWSKSYFSHPYMYFGSGSKNLLTTPSGDILFCVYDNSGSLILVKTDSDGDVVANDDPIIPATEFSVSHYPNPVRSQVTFRYNTPDDLDDPLIEIYNLRFQKVLSKRFPAGAKELSINFSDQEIGSLPSGLYFYRVASKRASSPINKIVILQ